MARLTSQITTDTATAKHASTQATQNKALNLKAYICIQLY